MGIEIELSSISQEEQITATYDLSTQRALTRHVHPQGQLSLDLLPEEAKDYVVEVDLNDDFFKRVSVRATTTAEWDIDGIASIRVEMRYGPKLDGTFAVHSDFLLTKDEPVGTWDAFALRDRGNAADAPPVLHYDYRVTVNYRASVALGDQSGEVTSAGIPGADAEGWIRRCFARNLVIHPRDVTPVHPVRISTGVLHFDLVQEVHIDVMSGPYSQRYRLTPEDHDIGLVIRPGPHEPKSAFSTRGTLFYRDGARVELPLEEHNPEQQEVIVNEPRDGTWRVKLVFADPTKMYKKATVTMRYEDGGRVVERDFDFTETGQEAEFSVRLEHPDRRKYTYRTLLMSNTGMIDVVDFQEGTAAQLVIGFRAAEVIPVNIACLQQVPSGSLLAVKVDLEYSDPDSEIHWAHSELIRQGHTGSFQWFLAIRDRTKRKYRYRVTAYRATGPEELPWTESSETWLVLPFLTT